MTCEEFRDRLDPWMKGLLPSADAHLAACASCRVLAEGVRKDAEGLEALFGEERARKDAVLALALKPRRSRFLVWGGMAAAAGLILHVTIFFHHLHSAISGPPGPPPVLPAAKVLAQLGEVSGPVQVLLPTGISIPYSPGHGPAPILSSHVLKTSPGATASILCSDGTRICLNSDSEVVFQDYRHVQVRKGEVWTLVASFDRPMRIDVEEGKVTPLGCILDVAVQPSESRLSTLSGAALFSDLMGSSRTVTTGKACSIRGGRIGGLETASCEDAWVDPLLEEAKQGPEDAETLLRRVESPQSRKDPEGRRLSARKLSELAEARHAGGLVGLLSDEDGEVRSSAAAALSRLGGPGAPAPLAAGAWEGLEGAGLEKACAPWQTWWAGKK